MMTTVNDEFIREALWDRYETIKEWGRVDNSEDDLFDRFVETVCECWAWENDTPKSLVDNRAINWYTGDYAEFVECYIKDDELYEKAKNWDLTDEDSEKIEDEMRNQWADFDRWRLLYHI